MLLKSFMIGSALAAAAVSEALVPSGRSALVSDHILQDVSVPYPYQDYSAHPLVSSQPFPSTFYTPDSLQAIIVPAPKPTNVGFSILGVFSLVVSYSFAIIKKVIFKIITSLPAFLIGVVAVFGVCKFTPICHKLLHWKSFEDAEVEIRSLATPERIARAADFMQSAIKKFGALQENRDFKRN